MAKKLFETFKKRYLKKKADWKRANRSGTSTATVEKAEKAYGLYKFFHWYDEFQRPRNVVTNSKAPRSRLNLEDLANSINSSSSEESPSPPPPPPQSDDEEGDVDAAQEMQEDNVIEYGNDIDEDLLGGEDSDEDVRKEEPKKKIKQSAKRPAKKISKQQAALNTDLLIGDLARSIKRKRSAQVIEKRDKDTEDFFGSSIALELRKMPEQLRVSAKSEIYQVIFKHQMMGFNNNANNAQVYQPKINYDQQRMFFGANQTSSGQSTNDMSFFSMANAGNSTPSTPTNMNNSGLAHGDVYNNITSPSF